MSCIVLRGLPRFFGGDAGLYVAKDAITNRKIMDIFHWPMFMRLF